MNKDKPSSPLSAMAFAYAIAMLLSILALPHLDRPLQVFGAPDHGTVVSGKFLMVGLMSGLGLGVTLSVIGQIITNFTAWGRRLSRLLAKVVGDIHPLDAALLAFLSAGGEELLFRGILLPYAGVIISSVIFGAAHFIPKKGLWGWSVWAAAVGYIFGELALETGGILAPFVAHFTVNFIGLLFLRIPRK